MRILQTLVLAPLLVLGTSALGQPAERFQHAHECERGNASRLPADAGCGEDVPEPLILRSEAEYSLRLRAPSLSTRQCQASVAINYHQRNTLARVAGSIENRDCAASSGAYTLVLNIRDSSGEYQRLELPQSWEREDEQTVAFSADHAIGEGVELVRARVVRVSCRCSEPAGVSEEDEGAIPGN